jgi:hypothetical protein
LPSIREADLSERGKVMKAACRIIAINASFLIFACLTCAQQAAPPERLAKGVSINGYWAAPSAHAAVIKGSPYSAEEVSDRTQTLADGTHITQKPQIVKLYRDSEGRTRREWLVGASATSEGVTIVHITDPVGGFRYLLDSYNRIAHRFSTPENVNGPAKQSQENHAIPPGGAAATALQVVKPPESRTNGPEVSTESLGSQIIEGVSAEGKRVTRTFPVGMMGNDRSLVSVAENWFSSELQVTVLSKNCDPRMGESSARLRNIERSEPDPALFRVPPDYQIVDDNHDHAEIKIP